MNYFGPIEDLNTIPELLAGPLLAFFILVIVFGLTFIIIGLVGRYKLFKKCGQAGWKSLIPFYGTYIQDVKIAGIHWAFFILEETWFFGLYSSVLVIIVKIMSYYNLAKKCQKDPAVTTIFGAVFPGIVTMVYGFSSKCIYDENEKVSQIGIFGSIIK